MGYLAYKWSMDNGCKHENEVIHGKQATCPDCGWFRYLANPEDIAFEKHTCYVPKSNRYDFKTHLDRHMKPLVKADVPGHVLQRVRGVFPHVYRTFFRLYPKRKNFLSYGFVLRKLLARDDCERYCHLLPTVKTPSKVAEAEAAWERIKGHIVL